jgi:acetylornithine deacetylase/succinyl-diaminopimelate desuccinylase-like protein
MIAVTHQCAVITRRDGRIGAVREMESALAHHSGGEGANAPWAADRPTTAPLLPRMSAMPSPIARVARATLPLLLPAALAAQPAAPRADEHAEERAILAELVGINSSSGTEGVPAAARAMAARLRSAGFTDGQVQLLGPTPELTALVVRYPGRDRARKPILLMAHLDVVPALRIDWDSDPFTMAERDGYYYGRGVEDNKAGVAAIVATLVRWKRDGWTPARDLVAVLTADEETDGKSMQWLLANHRALVDGEFALNTDAGGVALDRGRPLTFSVQASEKVFMNYRLEVFNPGGHSSVPRADQAITTLAGGLVRLGAHRFPARLNEVTRAFVRASAPMQDAATGALMRAAAEQGDSAALEALTRRADWFNATLRTTCTATRLAGGHADNALPQRAIALVNCRVLPDDPLPTVQATLQRVVGDSVRVVPAWEGIASPVSPLRPDVMGAIASVVRRELPGVTIVPEMSTGATDGLYTRNAGIPTYGFSALAFEQSAPSRAHGRDERIGVDSFHQSVRVWQRVVEQVAGGAPVP